MDQDSNELKPAWTQRRSIWLVIGLVCVIGGAVVIGTLMGVFTPSGDLDSSERSEEIVNGVLGTALPTETPKATATPTVTPTITPTPPGSTPVAVQAAEGWSFEGVRIQPDSDLGGLTIYGQAFNDSGTARRVLDLQSTLFDAQGGPLDKEQIDDYWPMEVVPAGWRMPFELTVLGPNQADRVELVIATEPGQPPRTDFELTELGGGLQGAEYCVTGQVRNPGGPLNDHLMAAAILYSDDDRVINWGTGFQPATAVNETGDEGFIMSACAETFNNAVARYELFIWGE